MPINSDKPHLWKADVARSIDFYNDWFLSFAPGAYRKQRFLRTNDPLLNELEKKQLAALKRWLLRRGYKQIASDEVGNFDAMPPGTFTIPLSLSKQIPAKTPIDCLVKPLRTSKRGKPFVIELPNFSMSKEISSSITFGGMDSPFAILSKLDFILWPDGRIFSVTPFWLRRIMSLLYGLRTLRLFAFGQGVFESHHTYSTESLMRMRWTVTHSAG